MNLKQWNILLASLIALPALADTDVYLTNNSDQSLTIQVSHDGSDLLEYGEEWKQHTEALGPMGDQASAQLQSLGRGEIGQDIPIQHRGFQSCR